MRLNGIDLSVDKGSGINGGKLSRINANFPYEYNKWRMTWNGNRLAPPEPSSVLWYPGYPGAGSTIYDFSYSFSDSGIDTDEALDATETGVDCDADATTAIPIGSVIIVESEWMYVTATGTTLTVIRGYHGTGKATHNNANLDIRVWIPNNGTIIGATWDKLPSGLPALSFDGGDDYVSVAAPTGVNPSTALTVEFWFTNDTSEASTRMVSFSGVDDKKGWLIRAATNTVAFALHNGTGYVGALSAALTIGTRYHVACVYNKINMTVYINGSASGVPTAETNNIAYTAGAGLFIGVREGLDAAEFFDGQINLVTIYPVALLAGQIMSHYQYERSFL